MTHKYHSVLRAGLLGLGLLGLGALSLNAGDCGSSSYEILNDGTYVVTDCWCKDPCQTWATQDSGLMARWCFNAANNLVLAR